MAALLPPADQRHHKDDLLGVCAALAEISGIAPLAFRIAFVLAMLAVSFEGTLIAYCVAGLAVQVARHSAGSARTDR